MADFEQLLARKQEAMRRLDEASRALRAAEAEADPREVIHFLHIGKNAGTQFRLVAEQVNRRNPRFRILPHDHDTALRHIPAGEKYLFSIRSPEARFRSAFYSRKRKGRPHTYVEWGPDVARAFAHFEHANDLAEALFEDGERGLQAMGAMKSIGHCSMDQIDWVDRCGYFLFERPPVAILRQEVFRKDVRWFLERIGFTGKVTISGDAAASHRGDYTGTPPLSDMARAKLFAWYRQDVEFYRHCEAWIRAQQEGA